MCGIAIGPVDLTRIIHYTFITPQGLTIHKAGIPALQMFLNARLYLYSNVYYHRTTRAIDIHLRDIFRATMQIIFPDNPLEHLEKYLLLTDASLLETVRQWPRSSDPTKQRLGNEWHQVLYRKTKWKTAYEVRLPSRDNEWDRRPFDSELFERQIRLSLPSRLENLDFRVDMANKDGRPVNPLNMGNFQIYVYDPSTRTVSKAPLKDSLDFVPSRIAQLRIFALNHDTDSALSHAAKAALDTL
jgi:HD superfamily phosphohydrolase